MRKTVVGTVSTRGWAVTPEERIREIINHFTESGFSQSVIYRGKIKSLSYLRACYLEDPASLADEVRDALTELLKNVFGPEGGTVEVETSTEPDGQSEVVYVLVITAMVTINGNRYDIHDSVRLIGEDNG